MTYIRLILGVPTPVPGSIEQGALSFAEPELRILGRTDRVQVPQPLAEAIHEEFPSVEDMWAVFHADDTPGEAAYDVTLYGKVDGEPPSFRLFDVKVGDKFLDWPSVEDVALKLGIKPWEDSA